MPGVSPGVPGPGGLYDEILKWEKITPDNPDYTQAQANIQEAENKLKDQVNGLLYKAETDISNGLLEDAGKAYIEAAGLDPRRKDISEISQKFSTAKSLVEKHEAEREKKAAEGDWYKVLEKDDIILTILPSYGPAISHRQETATRIKKLSEEHFNNGINRQKAGNITGARESFLEVLALDPGHAGARGELWLSREHAKETIQDYFMHVVKKGETISMLAERYYGDKFKFPLIASFNNLSDPTRIDVGQSLKIPQLESNPLPGPSYAKYEPSVDSSEYSRALLDQARLYLDEKRYSDSISEAEKFLKESPNDKEANDILVEAYYRQGIDFFQNNLYERSLDFFNRVKRMVPNYKDIEELIITVTKALDEYIDNLYKQGITFYRKQMLENAIDKWNKVLELNPGHEGALKYSEKAHQLLKKLKEIE